MNNADLMRINLLKILQCTLKIQAIVVGWEIQARLKFPEKFK